MTTVAPAPADVPAPAQTRRHLPALDGLRGTAILAVVICHYTALFNQENPVAGVLENGWAGVDLFFVISGFLITGILVDARGAANYFRNFYARRMLRIFPLYYGFLSIILVCAFLKGDEQLRSAQPWLWTYTANIWMAKQQAWSTWAEIIIPLWSLSIEEQFYLLWPAVIFCCSNRSLIRICLGVMAGALFARLILTGTGSGYFAIYILTPTRADSLAAGALIALLVRLPNGDLLLRSLCRYAGAIAFAAILVGSRGFDPVHHPWLRDLLYTSLAIFFASLLFWSIGVASLRGIPNRFYNLRILRIIGRYSYGIYIFHLPLMYLSRDELSRWLGAWGLIAVNVFLTAAISFLSFHLYEKQFLKLKRFFPDEGPGKPAG